MRDWGLVAPAELERIVVVSPHLDDAVLGCGRLLAAHPGATVITLYAGAPATYPDPPTRWDAIVGFGPGDDVLGRAQGGGPRRARRGRRDAGVARLRRAPVPRPAGLGRPGAHRRHASRPRSGPRTRRPCSCRSGSRTPTTPRPTTQPRLVRDRIPELPWYCYEDMGYQHIPGLLAWRVAQLFKAEIWPTPVAPDGRSRPTALRRPPRSRTTRRRSAPWRRTGSWRQARRAGPRAVLAPGAVPRQGWARLSQSL